MKINCCCAINFTLKDKPEKLMVIYCPTRILNVKRKMLKTVLLFVLSVLICFLTFPLQSYHSYANGIVVTHSDSDCKNSDRHSGKNKEEQIIIFQTGVQDVLHEAQPGIAATQHIFQSTTVFLPVKLYIIRILQKLEMRRAPPFFS